MPNKSKLLDATRIEIPVDHHGAQKINLNPRVDVTIDLDPDVVSKFQATGPGWRERMEAVLSAADIAQTRSS
ncbi:BrnA antitoxin family protein [Tianweitania sp. BSSL-BM11]|uniref:BrnA antitoxin family protein n=1 Tax=Tianweitania aestuarii TaxID=2814886 RepID=A0ABS5RW35_9HYPH|nr:BrnA antitoxin family protein [Tianweitania aestuarii]